MRVEDFLSERVGDRYFTALVELDPCPVCAEPMYNPAWDWMRRNGPFPRWMHVNLETQARRAGWVAQSDARRNNETICVECKAAGQATFECALCHEPRDSSFIRESVGDPPEYLCRVCYETQPAAAWEKRYEELREEHRYVYE